MTVLCYHAVEAGWDSPLAVDPAAFALQAEWLAAHRTVLPLSEAVRRLDASGRLPRGTAALTFDDGFASVHSRAWPVLARYRLPATLFVVAETLSPAGRPVDWVDTPPAYPMRTLSVDEVLAMRDGGLAFGSHSYAHHDLTMLGFDRCVADLRDSRELLEDLLGAPVPYLAYPRGRHDATVRRAAARAGYTYAFSLPQTREPVGPFAVPRVGVFAGNGVRTLRVKASHGYLAVRTGRVYPVLQAMVRRYRTSTRRPGTLSSSGKTRPS